MINVVNSFINFIARGSTPARANFLTRTRFGRGLSFQQASPIVNQYYNRFKSSRDFFNKATTGTLRVRDFVKVPFSGNRLGRFGVYVRYFVKNQRTNEITENFYSYNFDKLRSPNVLKRDIEKHIQLMLNEHSFDYNCLGGITSDDNYELSDINYDALIDYSQIEEE